MVMFDMIGTMRTIIQDRVTRYWCGLDVTVKRACFV